MSRVQPSPSCDLGTVDPVLVGVRPRRNSSGFRRCYTFCAHRESSLSKSKELVFAPCSWGHGLGDGPPWVCCCAITAFITFSASDWEADSGPLFRWTRVSMAAVMLATPLGRYPHLSMSAGALPNILVRQLYSSDTHDPFVAYWGFALMVTLPEKGRYRHHATRRSQESSVALVILL